MKPVFRAAESKATKPILISTYRGTNRNPILPDGCAIIIDEAHKLPETARQMFGITLRAEDIQDLIRDLRREKYLLAADALADTSKPLLRKLSPPYNPDRPFSEYARLLVGPNRAMTVVQKQLNHLLSTSVRKRLKQVASAIQLFSEGNAGVVFYTTEASHGGAILMPQLLPDQKDHIYYEKLAGEIAQLLEAVCGHALALFTSYAAMSAVKERLTEKELYWPLFTLGRNTIHTTEQFKDKPGSIFLATGAA